MLKVKFQHLDVKLVLFSDMLSPCAPMHEARSSFGACALGRRVIVSGGEHEGMITPSVEEYDPHSDSWRHLADMLTPRAGHGLVCVDRCLYAIGGVTGDDNLGFLPE